MTRRSGGIAHGCFAAGADGARATARIVQTRDGRMPGQRRGFTLIELLLVTAIVGVVVTAIGACLAGGIRAWEAARQFNTLESQALVGLRIVRRDIMNAVPFYAVPFTGSRREMRFLVRRPVSTPQGSGLYRVVYRFDAGDNALRRRVRAFPGNGTSVGSDGEAIITDVAWLAFAYTDHDGATSSDTWDNPTNAPARISIELDLDTDADEDLTLPETVVPALAARREEEAADA